MSRDVLEELVTKFVYDVDQLGLQKYTKAQEKINKNTKKMIGLNSTLAKGLRRLFVGAGAIMGVQGLVKTYRDIDLVRRSIEGLTKSTQDWDYIQKEALRTGTGIEQVAKGYRNFYSAASMAGFDKMGIQDMYSDVLTASRAIGATQQQVGGALLALEQMLSKGRVSMEELRRQLGNALPGAFEIGAKAMGVTTQKFNEMVKKGISAAEFVPKFTKELLNTYKEAFPEAIKSLDFALVNLSSSWKLFQYEIMNGSAGQGLAETINSITEFLRSPEAIIIAKGIGQALNLVAKTLGFVVKHFRMILFIFGVNALMKIPGILKMVKGSVHDLAMDIGFGSQSLNYGLNNVIYALEILLSQGGSLVPLLKAIGMSVGLLMKNLLPIFAIGAVIGTIALALEDIFLYLRDPNALTLTRELAEKSPEFAKMLERFRDGIKAISDVWENSLKPNVEQLFKAIEIWAGGEHSTLGGIFEWIIKQIGRLLGALGDVLMAMQRIDEANPFSEKNKKIKASRERVNQGAANWFNDPLPVKIGRGLTNWTVDRFGKNFASVRRQLTGITDVQNPSGYNLQKSETYAPTITNHVQINATDRSTSDVTNIVNSVLNGVIDRANGVMNFTPWYLRK